MYRIQNIRDTNFAFLLEQVVKICTQGPAPSEFKIMKIETCTCRGQIQGRNTLLELIL